MHESADVRRWLDAGARAVKHARERLDAINVFPVADSDTGTNLYLTLQEGNRAVAKLRADASHREVVAAFARGSLVGARGNSGVIISQYLTGFLSAIDHHGGLSRVDGRGIAQSLDAAAAAAYRAVGSPVEGTILTVARAAATGAQRAVDARAGRDATLVAAVEDARAALAQTHEQLPLAKEAGVVDAGAAGLVLQLEMLAETLGGPEVLSSLDRVEWEVTDAGTTRISYVHHSHEGAYEVMFVAKSDHDIHAALTRDLEAMGDSVAVTGTHGLWQAHVHTDQPHLAVERGIEAKARQIVVRNVRVGHDADRASTGIVALTHCPGLAEPLADAGAIVLVVPDPTALKRRALRRAVKDASGTAAVVVAGHPALRAAAEELARKRRKPRLTILDSQHEAQVIAAVAAAALVTPGQDLADEMAAAVAATVVGQSSGDALDDDVDRLIVPDTEVVSLILAAGMPASVADAVRMSVRAAAPDADVNVYRGQQAHPGVLIGVERAPS
ncbi:DAK2 domain-containing protein [Demequina muriae]|uniref:DAK2 domain-containing protein n=1 Tax=Demequina muriae TaxID=3051664 RepID=A0ABT8GIT1_9MICO|nr:DAK2 domain-containing protein [Demequina sp. EGI L300058]MDN4481327.1 DAK2 domain-containing protein [Demequina sp. EGI L300058]